MLELIECSLVRRGRQVAIDVKPGSSESPINPGSRGVVPVAILGSANLDVRDIDGATLRFGPSSASPAHDMDDAAAVAGHLEDVNLVGFRADGGILA